MGYKKDEKGKMLRRKFYSNPLLLRCDYRRRAPEKGMPEAGIGWKTGHFSGDRARPAEFRLAPDLKIPKTPQFTPLER